MAATVDGGNSQAYAEKDHWRRELTLLLRRLAHYVDDTCKGDPANMHVLVSSGFEARSRGRLGFECLTDVRRQVADLKAIRIQHDFHGYPGVEPVVAPPAGDQARERIRRRLVRACRDRMAINGAGGMVTRTVAPDLVGIERNRNDRSCTG